MKNTEQHVAHLAHDIDQLEAVATSRRFRLLVRRRVLLMLLFCMCAGVVVGTSIGGPLGRSADKGVAAALHAARAGVETAGKTVLANASPTGSAFREVPPAKQAAVRLLALDVPPSRYNFGHHVPLDVDRATGAVHLRTGED